MDGTGIVSPTPKHDFGSKSCFGARVASLMGSDALAACVAALIGLHRADVSDWMTREMGSPTPKHDFGSKSCFGVCGADLSRPRCTGCLHQWPYWAPPDRCDRSQGPGLGSPTSKHDFVPKSWSLRIGCFSGYWVIGLFSPIT